ncbi:hypothetical protein E1K64_01525 [Salmonella enterica subsp. enterica serovar Poona]|nr:hypothetical protein [Salmonella enterica subsp. enterica serovar Poona]
MNQFDSAEICAILHYLRTSGYCVSAPYTYSYFNVRHGPVSVSFSAMPSGEIVFRRFDYTYPGSYGCEIDTEEFYSLFPRRIKGRG